MKILFIMDPLKKCDFRWDNSLRLAAELMRRQHACWITDSPEITLKKNRLFCRAHLLQVKPLKRERFSYRTCLSQNHRMDHFDLVLIRKNPPVDDNYLSLMTLLEKAADKIPFINHPKGIRTNNEKLAILHFPSWIPKTIVSCSSEQILKFQKRIRGPVVIKPLNQKGGRGVFLLKPSSPGACTRLARATRKGRQTVMAQEFIRVKSGEKRIVLLNGDVLCSYEKRARGKDFRANLGLGASFHRSKLSAKEKKLCRKLRPFLLRNGLWFAGIDVLNEKLIEINVTSPAGVTEAIHLWPEEHFVEAWADFLEAFSNRFALKHLLK